MAMMVLHMSSHITSVRQQVAQYSSAIPICIYCTLLATLLWDLLQLTLNIFLFTETFLRVAVAGSVASLDPVPQASFMTTSNSFLFSNKKCD